MNPELHLYTLDPDRLTGDWSETVERLVEQSPLDYDIRGFKVRIWDPREPPKRTPVDGIGFRDGIQIQRVNLGDRRDPPAVGLSLCRLFFGEDKPLPLLESQNELFSAGNTPPPLQHLIFLPKAFELFRALNGPDPLLMPLRNTRFARLDGSVEFRFGRGRRTTLNDLSSGGRTFSSAILSNIRNASAIAPKNLHLALVPGFARSEADARNIAGEVAKILASEWKCSVSKALLKDSEDFEAWKKSSEGSRRVALLALDGKRGERPPQEAIDWLKAFSEQSIAFQLCSTQSNIRYSRHGLACSILSKAGGLLYETHSASVPDLGDHWCIGLDLGFGGQYEGKIAVMTLTDGRGRLRAYWRALKDEDETLSEEILSDGLEWIVSQAESMAADRKFLVFRDGTRPKNETLAFYRNLLPVGRSCLVECAKSGNPMFLVERTAPPPGTLGMPEGSDTVFLYPASAPQKSALLNTVKFFASLNDLGYSPEQLGEIITTLCHSPKLSFQPSSAPAPIYWADGLASLTAANLQFGGWSHLPNQTRNLR